MKFYLVICIVSILATAVIGSRKYIRHHRWRNQTQNLEAISSASTKQAAKQSLFNDLFKSYNKEIDIRDLDVKLGVTIIGADIDEKSHELTSLVWQVYSWVDSRLRWNPKDYDGVEKIRVSSELVWLPDIQLYNKLEVDEVSVHSRVAISSTGKINWTPQVTHKSLCTKSKTKANTWNCIFSYGSWMYDANSMNLQRSDKATFDLSSYKPGAKNWKFGTYEVAFNTTVFACCDYPYKTLDIKFEMLRQPEV